MELWSRLDQTTPFQSPAWADPLVAAHRSRATLDAHGSGPPGRRASPRSRGPRTVLPLHRTGLTSDRCSPSASARRLPRRAVRSGVGQLAAGRFSITWTNPAAAGTFATSPNCWPARCCWGPRRPRGGGMRSARANRARPRVGHGAKDLTECVFQLLPQGASASSGGGRGSRRADRRLDPCNMADNARELVPPAGGTVGRGRGQSGVLTTRRAKECTRRPGGTGGSRACPDVGPVGGRQADLHRHVLADRPGAPRRRFYYYLGGFDPEYARISPGQVDDRPRDYASDCEGACEFDFLRGQEDYKYKWGATNRLRTADD